MIRNQFVAYSVVLTLSLCRPALPRGDDPVADSVFHRLKSAKTVSIKESKQGDGKFVLADSRESGGDWPMKDRATIRYIGSDFIVLVRNAEHPVDGECEYRIPVSSIEQIYRVEGVYSRRE